jgi:hypothetical protein
MPFELKAFRSKRKLFNEIRVRSSIKKSGSSIKTRFQQPETTENTNPAQSSDDGSVSVSTVTVVAQSSVSHDVYSQSAKDNEANEDNHFKATFMRLDSYHPEELHPLPVHQFVRTFLMFLFQLPTFRIHCNIHTEIIFAFKSP